MLCYTYIVLIRSGLRTEKAENTGKCNGLEVGYTCRIITPCFQRFVTEKSANEFDLMKQITAKLCYPTRDVLHTTERKLFALRGDTRHWNSASLVVEDVKCDSGTKGNKLKRQARKRMKG